MRLAWILLLASCGRLGFTDRGGDGGGSGRAQNDAALDTVVATGLVAWYPMEAVEDFGLGGNSYALRDSTGNGHIATCTQIGTMVAPSTCPAPDVGHSGGAMAFNGLTGIANVADSADLHTTSAFTIAAWVKIDAYPAPGGSACIATKAVGTGIFNSWAMCYLENGRVYFYTVAGGINDNLTTPATAELPLAQWHHVAVTWDGAHKQIWFDAVVVASDNLATIDWDTMPVHIGADIDNDTATAYARAHIDELRFYNRALAATELAQLAQ